MWMTPEAILHTDNSTKGLAAIDTTREMMNEREKMKNKWLDELHYMLKTKD